MPIPRVRGGPSLLVIQIAEQLSKLATREEGERVLKKNAASKEELSQVARCIDVPVRKGDSVDVIRSRILAATIGYRLNSAAIQGPTGDENSPPPVAGENE